jgi:hypothetical protein
VVLKAIRIIAGIVLASLLLYAAPLATEDCATTAYSWDNCLWLWLRRRLGLRESRIGRAFALECVGLGLLAGLYLTVRYVFPFPRRQATSQIETGNPAPDPRAEP